MAEILTESYCERCGAKFTFESPAATSGPVTRARTFARGLRNYLTSDESLDEAIAEAHREQDRQASGIQLRAFHDTFSFCFTCRQYTCRDCWNEAAGRCRTCAPMPDAPDPLDLKELQAELTRLEEPAKSESWVADRLEPLTVDVLSWPAVEPSEPVAVAVSEPTEAEAPAAAGTTAVQPTGEESAAETDTGLQAEPAVAEAPPAETEAVLPIDTLAPESLEPEPLAPEPLAPESLEPEPLAVTAAAEPEADRALVAEVEPEAAVAPEAPSEAALQPGADTRLAARVAEPEAAAPEPEAAAPYVEAAAPEAEPALAEVEAEPEPAAEAEAEPEPAVQPAIPPAAPQVPIRQPRPPAPGPAPWQVVAPDERRLPSPGQPEGRPGDAAQRQMGWMLRRRENPVPQVSPRITRSVWEESTRDLVTHTGSGIQACQGCGLPLSASARFCRRCGARQV